MSPSANSSLGSSLQNPQGANFRLSEVPANVECRPVNLVAQDGAPSRGLFYRPEGKRPNVGVHLMHPRTDQSQNYNILPLVQAGYAVLGRASRWPNNDVATIHELLLLDVAAGVKFLNDQGCEQVVLLGNSGGGSLAIFYQAQACRSGLRLTRTPAGDPLDLNSFDLPPAAAILLVGGHVGQGRLLGKMLDAAVVDEDDPIASDSSLDIFDPANGFRTPPQSSRFSPEFLASVRAGQLDRARRLDAKARRFIQETAESSALMAGASPASQLRLSRAAKLGWHMIVYRTTADPAFVDLSIDPDDRPVFTYFSGRPDLENYGENGFARYVTPRAWLSTWSPLSSNAGAIDNLAHVGVPLLIVHYAGDAATRLAEVGAMCDAASAKDKTLEIVRGLDHYGYPVTGDARVRSTTGTQVVAGWMRDRFPL